MRRTVGLGMLAALAAWWSVDAEPAAGPAAEIAAPPARSRALGPSRWIPGPIRAVAAGAEEPLPVDTAEPAPLDTADGLAEAIVWLRIEVEQTDGRVPERALLHTRDCGAPIAAGIVDGHGEVAVQAALIAEGCEAWVERADGLLSTVSDSVWLEAEGGDRLDLSFVLPARRTGGIGVSLRPEPDGMRIVRVHPDTPAWEAGLEEGDLVVEVDGVEVAGLDPLEFQARMTGPEGSEVGFVVAYEGDTGLVEEPVVAVREVLE